MTLDESRQFTARAFLHACEESGIKLEVAAAYMQIALSQVYRQVHGIDNNHLSVQRLILIRVPKFWEVFLEDIRLEQGVQQAPPKVTLAMTELRSSVDRLIVEIDRALLVQVA